MKFAKLSANSLIGDFEKIYQRKIKMPEDLKTIAQIHGLIIMPWSEVCEPKTEIFGALVYKSSKHYIGINDLPMISQDWRNFVIAKAMGDYLINRSLIHLYLAEDLNGPKYFDVVPKPAKYAEKMHQSSLQFALELLMPAQKFSLDWQIHLSNPKVYTIEDIARQYQALPQAVTARAQYKLPS